MKHNIQNLMVSDNTITILGAIGDSFWEESNSSSEFLREFKNLEKKHNEIIVEINSPGGSMFHGGPIFNAIRNSKKEVTTRCIGMAASMAGIILLAGNKVEAYENSIIMLHSPSNFIFGNAKDFRNAADVLDVFESSIIPAVAKRTEKSKEEVKSTFFDYDDHFYGAEEAKNLKLVDTILDETAENIPDDIKDMSHSQMIEAYQTMFQPKSENILTKFYNKFISNKKTEDTMDLTKIASALGFEKTEDLTEDQVIDKIKTLVGVLAKTEETVENLTKEKSDLTTQKTEVEEQLKTTKSDLDKWLDKINAIDETISKAKTIEDKIEAFENYSDEDSTEQHSSGDSDPKAKTKPAYMVEAEKFMG